MTELADDEPDNGADGRRANRQRRRDGRTEDGLCNYVVMLWVWASINESVFLGLICEMFGAFRDYVKRTKPNAKTDVGNARTCFFVLLLPASNIYY